MPAPGRSDLGDGAPRYQLLGYLASGGMAELYFARVVGLAGFERHVVLKRIVAHHARDPEFVAMFLDEARLAAQLHHPNIAQVFDIGRMVDAYFFTMEYVHGESARALFRRCVAQQRTMPLHLVLTVVAGPRGACTTRTRSGAPTRCRSRSCTATSRRRTSSSPTTAP